MNPVLWRENDNTYHTSVYCAKVGNLDTVFVGSDEALRKRNMKLCKRDACATVPSFDIGELAFLKGFE